MSTVLGGLLLFGVMGAFLSLTLLVKRGRDKRAVSLAKLNATIEHMSRHLQVLDSQSHEYFNTLHENGLNEILRIYDSLVVVAQELGVLLAERDTEAFDALMEFLGQPSAPLPRRDGLSSVDLQELRDWPNRFDDTVVRLVEVLSQARKEREGLGISRPFKQVPTAVALSELHDLIKGGRFNQL